MDDFQYPELLLGLPGRLNVRYLGDDVSSLKALAGTSSVLKDVVFDHLSVEPGGVMGTASIARRVKVVFDRLRRFRSSGLPSSVDFSDAVYRRFLLDVQGCVEAERGLVWRRDFEESLRWIGCEPLFDAERATDKLLGWFADNVGDDTRPSRPLLDTWMRLARTSNYDIGKTVILIRAVLIADPGREADAALVMNNRLT